MISHIIRSSFSAETHSPESQTVQDLAKRIIMSVGVRKLAKHRGGPLQIYTEIIRKISFFSLARSLSVSLQRADVSRNLDNLTSFLV